MMLFLATLSLVVLKGISYNNLIENNINSFFGIQGYGVILVILLLFVITAPFAHSRIKKTIQERKVNLHLYKLKLIKL